MNAQFEQPSDDRTFRASGRPESTSSAEIHAEAGIVGIDILLVEDNPSYIELTRRALCELAGADLQVKFSGDGEEALDILHRRKTRPRLIVSDLNMPRMDGLRLLRRLRESPATRFLPVVMLTSSSRAEDITESYRLGANGYVVRPMNFQSYISVLSDIIAYWLVINRTAPHGEVMP